MQMEILNVPKVESKPYLRIATISNKAVLNYIYIGKEPNLKQLLSDNFISGISVSNFEDAKRTLIAGTNKNVDMIIINHPYDEKKLTNFHFFLKNRNLSSIPIIYSDHYLKNIPLSRLDNMVDDVLDFSNCDILNKISFLRKLKSYDTSQALVPANVKPAKSIIKRTLDILFAFILLLLLLPLFLIIAIAVKLESKGPVFYTSKRAGRGFRIFEFYKFRTMEVNADQKIETLSHLNQYNDSKGAKFYKISNDPRVTKVGRILRNTSLDELPQLFNVIKGDMSLVGNRPLPLYEAATLTTNDFVERFLAPAGITGLWQIKKRGKSNMSVEERISLDISYVKKSSLLYDFWIMLNTPKALIQKSDV